LTKIEGHATLTLEVDAGKVKQCHLSSIEGSRYFEGILKGRYYYEASELSSRICGICSCAHTLGAIHAVENAFGVVPSKQTMQLRKLLAIGERIRSHATHLYFLALPDYLGHESVFSMLPKYKPQVKSALRMMKAGNEIIRTVGGRDLHPVSAAIGGFLKFPPAEKMAYLQEQLKGIAPDVEATARLFGGLKNPDFEAPADSFSLYNGVDYPMFSSNLKSETRMFSPDDYASYIAEYHEPYSTANFVVKEGKTYFVGALARINNNFRFLSPKARAIAKDTGVLFPDYNPYVNNFAQALELVHYADEAAGICRQLKSIKPEPIVEFTPYESRGISATEVPRGILWHEYVITAEGKIDFANIVTPTAQNLRKMEEDIRAILPSLLVGDDKTLVMQIEKLIRSYDPCFSCSTHFLKVKWVGKKRKQSPKRGSLRSLDKRERAAVDKVLGRSQ
jgi:coenzyme F420-reducing hydrogenase alpha subunit